MRFIVAILTLALGAYAAPARPTPGSKIPNQYIVVFKKDAAESALTTHQNWLSTVAPAGSASFAADASFAAFPSIPAFSGFSYLQKYSAGSFRGYAAKVSAEIAEQLKTLPEVAYVQPDSVVSINFGGSGGSNTTPWGIRRLAKPDLPLPTNYTAHASAGAGVTAYVIDTGIYTAHPEFQGRAVWGATFSTDTTNADGHGHGTHVAGTIGSLTYGVAKKVNLVAVKVLDSQGSGSDSDVIAGVNWVATNAKGKKAVANMSLGGDASQALDDAVTAAIQSGVTFALAAGNESQDACNVSPSRTPLAITVAASDSSDRLASFSNTGKCVDVIAPGVSIKSTWKGGATSTNTIDGTSMASPHVAGAAAVILSAGLATTPAQVAAYLTKSAVSGKITGAGTATPNLLAQVPQ
ncbi:hypothetical protein HDU96_006477 [Phlyctochytrium bullatum]|nr:hypothetical protein HDU96_006477 [Phlyctochytrium bullatum]